MRGAPATRASSWSKVSLFGADGMKDSALFGGVGDGGGEGGEVGDGSLFEVKGHDGGRRGCWRTSLGCRGGR